MTTSYSTSLRLWEGTAFDPGIKGAWGTPNSTNFSLLENAITGVVAVNIAGLTTYSLTTANGATDQARFQTYNFTGALTGNCTVTAPNVLKTGWIINNTTGGYNVILSSGSGTTATIPPGGLWYWFYNDGAGNSSLPSVGFGGFGAISTLTVTGNATVGGTLGVTGNTTLSGTLTVTGNTTLSGTLTVTGNSQSNGYTYFGNSGQFYANPNNGGDQQFNFASGNFLEYAPGAGGFYFTSTGFITINAATGTNVVGTLGVSGATTLSSSLSVSGQVSLTGGNSTSSSGYYFTGAQSITSGSWGPITVSLSATGGLTAYGYFTYSDARAKSDIAAITPDEGAAWVLAGKPVTYIMDGKPSAGFIAQEELSSQRGIAVQCLPDDRPEFAESDGFAPAGHRLSRDYLHDIAYLTAALQHALARIDALEARTK